jgi:hypothetical protein
VGDIAALVVEVDEIAADIAGAAPHLFDMDEMQYKRVLAALGRAAAELRDARTQAGQ